MGCSPFSVGAVLFKSSAQEYVSSTECDLIKCFFGFKLEIGEITIITITLTRFEILKTYFKLIVGDDCLIGILGVVHPAFKGWKECF
jgi:hypothetical protein